MNDLIKCLTCAIIGVALGIEMKSTDDWWIQAIAIAVSLVILILLSVLFKTDKKEKTNNNDNGHWRGCKNYTRRAKDRY